MPAELVKYCSQIFFYKLFYLSVRGTSLYEILPKDTCLYTVDRVQLPGIMTFKHFLHKNEGSRYDFKSIQVSYETLEKRPHAVDDYKPLGIQKTANSDNDVCTQIRF
jgi:hypothetical protein